MSTDEVLNSSVDSDDFSGGTLLSIRIGTGLNVFSHLVKIIDSVQSVQETIEVRIGIPVFEQELYYRGEKLNSGSSIKECSITDNNAELQLVDKRQVRDILQNPDHEEAWEDVYDFVFLLDTIVREEENNEDLTNLVTGTLGDYLDKTPTQFEKAEKFINIFTSAALLELIIFCRSNIAYHNSCAVSLISILRNWSKQLSPPLQCLSVPIFSKLCTAFSRSSPEYHMTNACRSTLGDLMVNMKLSDGDRETTTTTHITFRALNAILANVFMDIGQDLTKKVSNKRLNPFCPLRTDVTDLINFLLPIKKLIGEDLAIYRVQDMTSLEDSLSQFIVDLGTCLSKLEELLPKSNIHVGCYEHIVVLRELSSSCQLFQGTEKSLCTMLTHRKVVFSYLMINYGTRSDNHEWINKHKEATTFECRRHLAMFLLPVLEDNIIVELPRNEIERSQLWEQSLKYITEAGTDSLQAGLSLKFKDEEAIGPGVTREWFYLVSKELFGSERDLFQTCPNDHRRIFPKSASNVNLDHFKFAGRVIALALMHKVQIGIMLDPVLFLQLGEKSVSLEDIQDTYHSLYNSSKAILDMDPEKVDGDTLALTFTVDETDESGSKKLVGLVYNGDNIRVNSKNRREYVDLCIQYWFVKSVAKQVDQLKKGFNDIISSSEKRRLFFQSLELDDIDRMLHGSGQAISVTDWKAHTEYNGYNETDDQIVWFWQIVEKMSAEQRNNLLFFWTSIRYLPIEGFTALFPHISIHKTDQTLNHLPSSHTCNHQLCFPPYPSSKVMEDRLNTICHEHNSCRFGYI